MKDKLISSKNKFLTSFDKVVKGLQQEKDETREMMQTFFKVLTQKLPDGQAPNDEEVQAAVEQLKDVHRIAGLMVVSALPGSIITVPALCSLGRRYGIEFLPSAFQNDETLLELGISEVEKNTNEIAAPEINQPEINKIEKQD